MWVSKFQTGINTGLGRAQAHANTYLNVIQPNILQNISNISNYYALHNAVPTALPSGSTKEQWIEVLASLQSTTVGYQATAQATVVSLQGLHANLTQDAGTFSGIVVDLNTAVTGTQGVLASIDEQLTTLQSQIDGTIAGIVISGLAIVGGIFITAVGAVAGFVTAGASTPLMMLGGAIVLTGIGGAVAAALGLKALNDTKATLLTQKAQLNSEVQLALGMSNAYSNLSTKVGAAVTAAQQMATAWTFLKTDLETLSNNLKNGIEGADAMRLLFLTAANSQLQTQVITDIGTIKKQMAGVTNIVAPSGQNVGDAIVAAVRARAAA